MIICPCCKTQFTINEMIDQWGYDVGDFQPDIVSEFEVPNVPEPEWSWKDFFQSLEWDKRFQEIEKDSDLLEEYNFSFGDLPFPVGSVGSC